MQLNIILVTNQFNVGIMNVKKRKQTPTITAIVRLEIYFVGLGYFPKIK